MSNSAIALAVNINSLIEAGWSVELETGRRGGDLRSWVTLRHFEAGERVKLRAQHTDITAALLNAMKETDVAPWDPCSSVETIPCRVPGHTECVKSSSDCKVAGECTAVNRRTGL